MEIYLFKMYVMYTKKTATMCLVPGDAITGVGVVEVLRRHHRPGHQKGDWKCNLNLEFDDRQAIQTILKQQ